MATTTKFSLEKRLASGFTSAAKVAGRLYFISDQGGLFLGVGTAAADYIQIGVGIGSSNDPASSKTYYGLRNMIAGYMPRTGDVLNDEIFRINDTNGDQLLSLDGGTSAIDLGNPSSVITMTGASAVQLPANSTVLNGATPETIASQAYVTRQIAALGTAITYVGESTTDPLTSGATVSGHTTWKKGEVVTYGVKEYILVGTTNVAANWRSFGDEGSYALKTVTITGTGYLTGGGTLESNRTIDINQTTKNKIDGAIQTVAGPGSSVLDGNISFSKSGTTSTMSIRLAGGAAAAANGGLQIVGNGDGIYVALSGSSLVDGTLSSTNPLLSKSAADGYYAAKSSAITSITFAGTALTVSSNAASITQAAARTALGLGSAAYVATTTFATAAQGTKADSAVQSVASGNTTALTVSTSNHAVTVTPVTGAVADNNGKLTTAAQVKSYVDSAVAGAVIYWESF